MCLSLLQTICSHLQVCTPPVCTGITTSHHFHFKACVCLPQAESTNGSPPLSSVENEGDQDMVGLLLTEPGRTGERPLARYITVLT